MEGGAPRRTGQERGAPAVALAGVRLTRPEPLGGAVEISRAGVAARTFPAHVSDTIGICLKTGGDHRVVADGRRLVYPEDQVSVRAPGCVWSSGPEVHGFLAIDVDPSLAPGLVPGVRSSGEMRFADARTLPSLRGVARAVAAADSSLVAEEVVTGLVEAVLTAGLLSRAPERGDPPGPGTVDLARAYLAAHLAGRPTLAETAAAAGVDTFGLLRAFRQASGTTPHAFLVMLRLARAQRRLGADRDVPLGDVAAECGFADQAHLGRWFRRVYGVTPAAYRRAAS